MLNVSSFNYRVEVPLDHFATVALDNIKEENDIDVPLPTDQVTVIFILT